MAALSGSAPAVEVGDIDLVGTGTHHHRRAVDRIRDGDGPTTIERVDWPADSTGGGADSV
jgi:hypothetical protein